MKNKIHFYRVIFRKINSMTIVQAEYFNTNHFEVEFIKEKRTIAWFPTNEIRTIEEITNEQ